ncbi:uncharacterized protein N7459_008197 [Penicillium hispanicum]|uniref:uncharacterized protein n=1 Tax=Penicillium hispanicum TaxID=1080232 RepID=UPI002542223A|nr:uncharacterized protein N7459_008197 [Penicillium hispanicum]KAJ5573770.1 hypothetical protein N7459_008197 [Penicillium hispanicum]
MTPPIIGWADLTFVSEEVDSETNAFQYTSFGFIDHSDTIHYGELKAPKNEISLTQLVAALQPVADDAVYPQWPLPGEALHEALEPPTSDVYIKRPALEFYKMLKELGIEKQISSSLLAEAHVLEELSQYPHPNLIRYHGCRIARGHVTGVVLDRHPHDLQTYIECGYKSLDNALFMTELESAIQHLHGLGWAHNDLTPTNILVSEGGKPILIDFGGCQKFGTTLTHIRGTKEWIDGETEDYTMSEAQHDISALGKIRVWLEDSRVMSTSNVRC